MIKDISIKKILKYTVLLLIVFLFYLFPEKNELQYSKETYKENRQNNHEIFLIDKNNYIAQTKVAINSTTKDNLIDELIEIMIVDGKYQNKIPNGFSAILPANTQLINKTINNDTVELNFNSNIFDVKGEYEEKIVECLIYTLTSIKGINNVKLKVDNVLVTKLPKTGKVLDETLNRNYGINKEYDIDSLNDITKVTVYYLNKNNVNESYYIPVTKYLNSNDEKIKIIVDELTSNISYESNLISYLNYNAKLIDYSFDKDQLDLNFNEYLFDNENNKKVLEEVIYSISYSVKDNYNVSKINFFVNNKKI